jgi:predicted acyl esterase
MGEQSIRIDLDVAVAMRDGVVLRADVFRPDGADAHPALVVRMPYNKSLPRYYTYFDPVRMVKHGVKRCCNVLEVFVWLQFDRQVSVQPVTCTLFKEKKSKHRKA